MNKLSIAAIAALACCGTAFAGPFDQLKGKMKEGLYEYKMDMEMPGMPGGMGKQSHTMQHCVSAKDIEGGDFAKGAQKSNCEFQDVKVSGNNASYRMVCPEMTADTKMSFRDNGFVSDMKMSMKQGGQVMNMTQHMEGKYLGPCK
jgi:uncharacterized protein DUF3617